MNSHLIKDLQYPPLNPSSGNPPDDVAINFKYFHEQRQRFDRLINEASAETLPKDGSESMEGNIDMNNHAIINLKELSVTS